MDILIQQLINALSLGGTYALLALGLAIVFSMMGLINFAHGELMSLAGYGLWVMVLVSLPFGFGIAAAVLVGLAAAVAMERIAFRPVRNASGAALLLTSFAVSNILQVLFQIFISPRARPVPIPSFLTGALSIGPLQIGAIQAISIGSTLVLLLGLTLFFKRSHIGISMRAAAGDFDVARLMGIRANAVIATAFAISGILAGFAATFWVAQRGSVDPLMGFLPVLKAFIAVIVGGLGSLSGAVAGGFLLAFIEIGLRAFLPDNLIAYRDAVSLALIILILLARPQGLLGRKVETVR
ncbi:MAG TPA: branched-chain amino acid ABC transporter permease [Dongiaceae bacterium]|jgi:branched-chain amino acid transport system permease protein